MNTVSKKIKKFILCFLMFGLMALAVGCGADEEESKEGKSRDEKVEQNDPTDTPDTTPTPVDSDDLTPTPTPVDSDDLTPTPTPVDSDDLTPTPTSDVNPPIGQTGDYTKEDIEKAVLSNHVSMKEYLDGEFLGEIVIVDKDIYIYGVEEGTESKVYLVDDYVYMEMDGMWCKFLDETDLFGDYDMLLTSYLEDTSRVEFVKTETNAGVTFDVVDVFTNEYAIEKITLYINQATGIAEKLVTYESGMELVCLFEICDTLVLPKEALDAVDMSDMYGF